MPLAGTRQAQGNAARARLATTPHKQPRAALLIDHDDSRTTFIDVSGNYAEKLGLPLGCPTITGLIASAGSYMSSAQLVQVNALGHRMHNHTTADVALSTLTLAQQETAITDARNQLIAWGLPLEAYHLTFPKNVDSDTNADSDRAAYNTNCLTVRGSRYNLGKATLPLTSPRKMMDLDVVATSTTLLETFKAYINDAIATRRPLLLVFHDIKFKAIVVGTDWLYENYVPLLDYISECTNRGDLAVLTREPLYMMQNGGRFEFMPKAPPVYAPDTIYIDKVKGVQTANLLGLWSTWNLKSGLLDNHEGTAARDAWCVHGTRLHDASAPDGANRAPYFDQRSLAGCVDLYSANLGAAFNGAEGTLAVWFKADNVAIWTDGTVHKIMEVTTDGNNFIQLQKSTTNNRINGYFKAGGTLVQVNANGVTGTTWQHIAITWSTISNSIHTYLNGADVGGSVAIPVTPWVGVLTAGSIGGIYLSATNWSGWLAYPCVWSKELTAAEVATIAAAP